MTYTPIQISAIKMFGRKDLTEGCKVKAEIFGRDEYFTCIGMRRVTEGVGIYQYDKFEQDGVTIEILGHIPHLEDLFRVAEEKGWDIQVYLDRLNIFEVIPTPDMDPNKAHSFPFNPTIPLLDQPNLEEILNLFKNA